MQTAPADQTRDSYWFRSQNNVLYMWGYRNAATSYQYSASPVCLVREKLHVYMYDVQSQKALTNCIFLSKT